MHAHTHIYLYVQTTKDILSKQQITDIHEMFTAE